MERTRTEGRLAYLENLRSFVMILVVAMHSNVTYSGMGGWYYKEVETSSLDLASRLVFGLYGSFTQAWFMGALFMAGGFFAARSLAKRGFGAFAAERLRRLGTPLAVFVFAVHPLLLWIIPAAAPLRDGRGIFSFYAAYVSSGRFVSGTGPLWFCEALIVFCLAYGAFRALKPAPAGGRLPRPAVLAAGALAAGLAAFAVRLAWPIGTSIQNLQPCFFPSYVFLFALGAKAGEGGWLDGLLDRYGRKCLLGGLGIGLAAWAALMAGGGALEGDPPIYGGLHWQSLAYAVWEAFVALGVSVGVFWLFREKFGASGPLWRFAAANSFGVFMLHAPVLVAASLAAATWTAPPLAKHIAVFPAAYLASIAASAAVRRIGPAARLLR